MRITVRKYYGRVNVWMPKMGSKRWRRMVKRDLNKIVNASSQYILRMSELKVE